MEDIYFLGFVTSLALNVFRILGSIGKAFSHEARNMKKQGQYINPLTGQYRRSKPGFFSYVLSLSTLFIIAPLFSWVFLAYEAWLYLKLLEEKISTPDRIKELQYRFSKAELTEAQLAELDSEFQAFFHGRTLSKRNVA